MPNDFSVLSAVILGLVPRISVGLGQGSPEFLLGQNQDPRLKAEDDSN
jgi:hypothetical protein